MTEPLVAALSDDSWTVAADGLLDEVRAQLPHRRRRRRLNQVGVVALAVLLLLGAGGLVLSERGTRPSVAAPAPKGSKPLSGSWSEIPAAPLAAKLDGESVVWTGTELIVWGGQAGDGGPLQNSGAAYDPATGGWRRLAPSPLSPRIGQSAAWAGGRFVVWGGWDVLTQKELHVVSDGAAYDPSTDTWSPLPRSPLTARTQALAVSTGDSVVLLGGQPAVTTNTVHDFTDGAVYDPGTRTWSMLDPPVAPNGDSLDWLVAVQQAGGPLRAFARTGHGIDEFSLDVAARRWTFDPDHGPINDFDAVVRDGTGLYATGRDFFYNGGMAGGPPGAAELATAHFDAATGAWTRLPDNPLGIDHVDDILAVDGQLFVFNDEESMQGPDVDVEPGDADTYDPATSTWTRLPRAPFGNCDGSPVLAGRQILLFCPTPYPTTTGSSGLAFTLNPPP